MAIPKVVKTAISKTRQAIEFDSGERYHSKIKKYARSIDLEVYKKSLNRSLRLLQSILIAAHSRDIIPKLCGTKYFLTYKDRRFKFHMREERNEAAIYDRTFTMPLHTGILVFSIYPPDNSRYFESRVPEDGRSFCDEGGKLESRIEEIADAFVQMYEAQIKLEEEKAREAEKRKEEQRIESIKEAKRKSARHNLDGILKAERMWRKSRQISEFLAEVEKRLPKPYDDDTSAWMQLCRQVIEACDPFQDGPAPWEDLLRAEHDGEMVPFITYSGVDPHDEIARLIRENSPKASVCY